MQLTCDHFLSRLRIGFIQVTNAIVVKVGNKAGKRNIALFANIDVNKETQPLQLITQLIIKLNQMRILVPGDTQRIYMYMLAITIELFGQFSCFNISKHD